LATSATWREVLCLIERTDISQVLANLLLGLCAQRVRWIEVGHVFLPYD
jgi:hypothetical protein